MTTVAITVPPFLAKWALFLNPFHRRILVVCQGYGEDSDYGEFTELVWEDDKYLSFYDAHDHGDFQIWIRVVN